MGNALDKRAHFEGGYLYVKTDRPYYYPGNVIYGKIYIRTMVPMQAQHIEIKVKGKEKASYVRHETIQHRDAEGKIVREEHREIKERFKRMIMDFKGICFTFQGPLNPGDYVVPFEFQLPENLPSSMMFKRPDLRERPSCKVKYSIRATITTHDNKQLKYKQWLIVHEPPVQFQEGTHADQTVALTTCCCCAKGQANMKVTFNKNIFYSNETALANVAVDNSQSKLRVKEVEFQVVQKLRISHWGQNYDIIENKDLTGISPGETNVQSKQMALNLASIRYVVSGTKYKKKGLFSGQWVERSPEEMFLMQQLPPACHSKYISNDYLLNVNVKFDGCTCCSSLPSISVPLTVIPLTHPESYGFTEPQGYQAMELGYFKFSLNYHQF